MKVALHLGLGDTIACAAIIAKLADQNPFDIIEIPCWKHNEVSVKSFFVNYKNVKVVPFEKENETMTIEAAAALQGFRNDSELKLGFYGSSMQNNNEDFVQWFYRQAGMDIEEKEKWCPIDDARILYPQSEFPQSDYGFFHYDKERGFIIDGLKYFDRTIKYISPVKGKESILTWFSAMYHAKEIHCIDSSFLHLVECLPTTGKLFYHKYARPNSPDYKYLKKEWQVLN